MYFGRTIVFYLVLVHIPLTPQVQSAYTRNNGVLNINWVYSLPWDVSNTLRAPLGGPLGLILCACFGVILFFGMAASFVYYFLGTPPRKYHLNDAIFNHFTMAKRSFSNYLSNNSTLEMVKSWVLNSAQIQNFVNPEYITYIADKMGSSFVGDLSTEVPDQEFLESDQYHTSYRQAKNLKPKQNPFIQNFVRFIGEEDETCQKLIFCQAHAFLPYVYDWVFKTLRSVISKTAIEIPLEFQRAAQIGLKDPTQCILKYKCKSTLLTLFENALVANLPTKVINLISKSHNVRR